METRSIFPVEIELETRRGGGFSAFFGSFPYRSRAVIRDRGRIRKEEFEAGAFAFALNDKTRDIHLLSGHDYNRPLASRNAGSLELTDGPDALRFRAEIPDDPPTWIADAVKATAAGLTVGVSPGFRVPPRSTVPNAEELIPEEGNPGVSIRRINQAVLFELSLVTRPAYGESTADVRSAGEVADLRNRRLWLCL